MPPMPAGKLTKPLSIINANLSFLVKLKFNISLANLLRMCESSLMNTDKNKQIEACNVLIDALIDDKEAAEIFQSSQLRERALETLNSIRSRIED